jgi:hypothetical protein
MCLIAYVPAGLQMPDDYIDAAHRGNNDGIGIMSEDGVRKFLGRKALKRAKRYLKELHEDEIEYAIHFRYATHGAVTNHNCHPHELPNGNGWLMHNGVLSAYTAKSTALDSDTVLFSREHTHADASNENHLKYWGEVSREIGSNKLCIMLPNNEFILVNGSYGVWRDKIWYSQTYSLPAPKYAGHGGYYRPYVYSGEQRKTDDEGYETTRTGTTAEFKPDDESATGTRLYPKGGDDVGERWGNWVRKYDKASGRAYYVLPPHSERNPPLLTQVKVEVEPPINTALREALARQDTASPWAAWDRDRDGNDPAAADKALDRELAKHLENNCAVCFVADVPVDEDGICGECLRKECEAEDKTGLLPGWSDVTDYEPGTCIECSAKSHSGNTDFCGEAFCIGIGFKETVCDHIK